jgi:outer membrane protein assembly factor BamB
MVQSDNSYPWANWWAYSESSYDINDTCSELVLCNYDGLYGINWANGNILWHYTDPSVPFESPYGENPFFTNCEQADGMVYSYAAQHSPRQPIVRSWNTVCVNASTGALIWEIDGSMSVGAIADGYLTAANSDDGYMYVFGMGKSATTVEAPLNAVTQGTPVLIQGTVLDESPAQPGTPCVSDASMENQMEYLHMQQPITGLWGNITMTGVPVTLTATDQSGTVYNIGTATTNAYDGTFGISWTPPSAGIYHIAASYYGDDSYGSSGAGTELLVVAAPTVTATPTLAPTATPSSAATASDVMLYIVAAAIAIIIAIAIVGVLMLRTLRKRP